MQTWKKVFSSAIFRLVVIVMAVVVPLNLLTLILGNTVITEVERQISLETRNALELYISQIDDAMVRINTKLYLLARENSDFSRLNEKEIVDRTEYYRQMESVVRLGNTLSDELKDNVLIDGTFAYFPEKGYFIMEGGSSVQTNAVRNQVERAVESLQKEEYRIWRAVNEGGQPYLLLISGYRKAYYGAWISLQELAHTIGLYDESDSVLQALTSASGEIYLSNKEDAEKLNMDTPSQKFNGVSYTLVKAESRYADLCYAQVLSKSQIASSLPSAIRVLQILSVVAVLIIPVILFAMQHWIARPVSKLVGAMERIEQGDMNYRIPKSRVGSEFDRINSHFNQVMDEVGSLTHLLVNDPTAF